MFTAITPPMWLALCLFLVGIAFNAGGFVWLAKNHFHSVTERLDKLEGGQLKFEATLTKFGRSLAYIRGRLRK